MNQFVFTIKDNNQKAFNTFFWFLYFLHLIVASVIVVNTKVAFYKNIALASFVVLLLLTSIFYIFKNKVKLYSFQLVLFAVMVLSWPLQSAWLPFVAVTVIIIFALRVLKTKSTATFTAENVQIKRSLFTKQYPWAVLENVVLKDNLLSVDLKNNHLIQLELAAESTSTNEAAFNQFCRQQLQPLNF
jgi:hypothetical protein